LTRSVGSNASVAVETLMFEARPNDVLLLCTDGLSSHFHDDKVVAEMLSGKNVHEITDSLVRYANENGGEDNITAVVIRIANVEAFALNSRRIRLEPRTKAVDSSGRKSKTS
jgi:protein phosphatase